LVEKRQEKGSLQFLADKLQLFGSTEIHLAWAAGLQQTEIESRWVSFPPGSLQPSLGKSV